MRSRRRSSTSPTGAWCGSAATVDGGFFHHDKQTYQLTLDDEAGGLRGDRQEAARPVVCHRGRCSVVTIPQIASTPSTTRPRSVLGTLPGERSLLSRARTNTSWNRAVRPPRGVRRRRRRPVRFGLAAWRIDGRPWATSGSPTGVVVVVASRTLKRRTREAAELHAKYRGLRNYMHDFGRMQEKPPTAVALWEQYLVLATVFGMADEVIADMKVKVPGSCRTRRSRRACGGSAPMRSARPASPAPSRADSMPPRPRPRPSRRAAAAAAGSRAAAEAVAAAPAAHRLTNKGTPPTGRARARRGEPRRATWFRRA